MRSRSHSAGEYGRQSDFGFLGKGKVRRCMSVPDGLEDVKSVMKCRTLDESLHSVYGAQKNHNQNIKFGTVGIREYGRTLGDNPSCSSGPPVSISWDYNVLGEMEVEEYEETRPARRSQMEMVLPRKLRFDMLRHEWNVSQKHIAEAVRRNVRTKSQRRTTVNNLGKASKVEQLVESFSRKLKRTLTLQKPVSVQVRDLEAKHNEATRLRKQYILELAMRDEYEDNPSVDTKTAETEENAPVPCEP